MKRPKKKQQIRKENFFQPLVVTIHDENEKNFFDLLFTEEERVAWLANPFSGVFFQEYDDDEEEEEITE